MIGTMVADDFGDSETVNVDGWILSKTEVALFVLTLKLS